jgi:hypothetical protein
LLSDYWGLTGVHLYDPCYQPYAKLPTTVFDGVISTDMLEHCGEEDIPWIIDEIFSFAKKFVFANVACYPAKKTLPNGENAHCTIKDAKWWNDVICTVGDKHPHVMWEVVLSCVDEISPPGKPALKEVLLSGN